MSPTRNFGVRAGEQVPLQAANRQAAEVSEALQSREHAAARAAAQAVARALKSGESGAGRLSKALRASARRKEG